ncbi:acyclic terpene utilization AtuA family protein [Bosea sp. (in: a-proteobacteria)]|uniref:acyclic terpene utilization AtuA family protein n=1 Tax=Bosea sp. (in: a-proteobacteria) TaxID=1871050 RepID=UPI00262CFB9B|nr:acyclic terpene utilization AtuA family protein [Bosea sp. (in: a-proteobacteria)]MCO5091329.1 DUF1446 domain-containing protein [Bosea sp. (in: a-proteobacteria)]
MATKVYIGGGAGFADERPDAVEILVGTLERRNGPRYIILETLAERTLALAQLERRRNPDAGYTPQLGAFLRPILTRCVTAGIRIVCNSGAANPRAAAALVFGIARELGLEGLRVGLIEGDDLLGMVSEQEIRAWPTIEGLPLGDEPLIAANVYLGARPIAEALNLGAHMVITGRCTDSALVLGPLISEFGWTETDWDLLAAGTLAGHLLECSAQVSGGYFADPGYKDVPDLGRIGFPIGEVEADGRLVITKADDTGGLVSTATVTEQLLYEMHDPAAYVVPDVVLDVTAVRLEEAGPNRVAVTGARGRPRPETLKATLSVEGGFLAEGEITYAGPNALARAELAAQVLAERLRIVGIQCPTRIDLIGAVSSFDGDSGTMRRRGEFPNDGEYRVRLAGNAPDKLTADRIANEVIGLYSTGPGGGGGVRKGVTGRVQTRSVLLGRDLVKPTVEILAEAPL